MLLFFLVKQGIGISVVQRLAATLRRELFFLKMYLSLHQNYKNL